ncbi:MAG: sigma-70 family RNA polymerase sigma factor [Armatimonadota bacterium]|nr:sigma-70 family RNA polymerase sigma factor [bacterium]MDW8320775.1 sigma-70 family RNA polymerase sigma factor [Armatimonadota bacterium]
MSKRYNDNEVQQLVIEYHRTGDLEIRERIVEQFPSLVESIARRFMNTGEPLEDLIQEGYLGLLNAIDLYKPEKGTKFSTYATHLIVGQIKHYLRDRGKIIKVPAWIQELQQKLTRVVDSLSQQLGRQPTPTEIGAIMNMDEKQVEYLLSTSELFRVASLETGDSEEDEHFSGADIEKLEHPDGTTLQVATEERVVLEHAMERLKDIERRVLYAFFYEELSQTEIARQLGVSCNYVSHILRNSTKKLRRILVTEELKDAQAQMMRMQQRMMSTEAELRQPSIVDPVTGCYNRRYFESRLDEEINRASRYGYALGLVIIRVGGSQQFIRQHGLNLFEGVIARLAPRLRSRIRKADIPARIDVSDIAIILPYTGEQAEVVRQRLSEETLQMLREENLLDSGLWVESASNHVESWVNLREFIHQTQCQLRAFWGRVQQDMAA